MGLEHESLLLFELDERQPKSFILEIVQEKKVQITAIYNFYAHHFFFFILTLDFIECTST